jgi:hypothetical protein
VPAGASPSSRRAEAILGAPAREDVLATVNSSKITASWWMAVMPRCLASSADLIRIGWPSSWMAPESGW